MVRGGEVERIELSAELALPKIVESGQCFRPVRLENGLYRLISGQNILYCRQRSPHELEISCGKEEWEAVWVPYFDLKSDYRALCETAEENAFLSAALEHGRGLRILRQDHWEMLISFLLSQRKSIPAIRTSIQKLCGRYGAVRRTAYEEAVFLFPTPEALRKAEPEELCSCGLGYRVSYVKDAAEKVLCGALPLQDLETLDDEALFDQLCRVRGVGKKVANCVMLFAYGRYERVPSDVWIQRIVEKKYAGREPFSAWRGAGILQQHLFYYALKHKEEFTK